MESELFYEIYNDLPRVGPGDDQSTFKALEFTKSRLAPKRILDISAGTGQQTFVLANNTSAIINALDNNDTILSRLESEAKNKNIASRIFCFDADMNELPFDSKEFDLIWCEGSIFIIGFEKALKYWKTILKDNGIMAITELNWLTDNPPEEITGFWKNGYPAMINIEQNLALIKQSGYEVIEHFVLPEEAWWKEYYTPLEKRLKIFREKYSNQKKELMTINYIQTEIDMYRKYKDYYGYVFYIIQLK